MYNDIVLDHFTNPRNVGKLADADGIGRSGNPVDGDTIVIYIKVKNGTLHDVRFKTFGCGAAIAASSMLTVLAIGKSLEYGMTISNDDVAEALGGLPPQKLLCSNIAADALHAAISDYLANKKTNLEKCGNLSADTTQKTDLTETNSQLTDKKQIQRYLRHIIMPRISGSGQKKLIETSVLLCAPDINTCDVLLSYMAAAGIGNIYCYIENSNDLDSILTHVHDLNPDTNIKLLQDTNVTTDFNIILGNYDFANKISNLIIKSAPPKLSPTFIAIVCAWQGYVNLCKNSKLLSEFLSEVSMKCASMEDIPHQEYFEQLGTSMSYSFLGPLLTIELIKVRLNIGNILNDSFYYNLWNTSFINNISGSEGKYQNINYSFDGIKQSLSHAKILIVGTGGLGCPAALTLAKSKIGTLGLIDFDNVELSNLNRQILHTTSKIGISKVESAKRALKTFNKDISIDLYKTSFSQENASNIIKNYDLIVDGLDNIPTRYLLNDACFFEKKPLVEAGALTFYGQVTTIIPGNTPCYRCIFPESETERSAPSCSETGILGPVPGLMGILQAIEAVKMIIGFNSSLKGRLLAYDSLETEFEVTKFIRNDECKLCGKNPTITQLSKYVFVCKDKSN